MSISTADFKTGLTIELEGVPYQIIEFQHVKPGKGGAFVRTKLRQLQTGAVLDRRFRAGEKMELAHIERKQMEFLYRDGEDYVMMDMDTYDQLPVPGDRLGDVRHYLKENDAVTLGFYDGNVISADIPASVELAIAHTEPGVKGDTASSATKPATLETGYEIQVPLFINTGDVVKVDTRSGAYMERVSAGSN